MLVRFVMSTARWRDMLARSPNSSGDTAVHAVDTLRYIAGEIGNFECRPMKCGTTSTCWYAINLQFESGVEGRIDVLPTAGMIDETYEFSGEGFHVSVTCPFGGKRGWSAYRNGELITEKLAPSDMAEDVLNGCYDETVAFIRALRDGYAPKPSIADVVPSVGICLSIAGNRSARQQTQP